MQELIAQLERLYWMQDDGAPSLAGQLAERLAGREGAPLVLARSGLTRAVVLPFARLPDDGALGHWERLCGVANALQSELQLPAAAVSMSGARGFALWLSLAEPLPLASAQQFANALRTAFCPELPPLQVDAPVELPPCLDQASGKWSAFIHPGMGSSFAEEPGLDVAPPPAAQAAFLDGLQSIDAAQLQQALELLAARQRAAAPARTLSTSSANAAAGAAPDGLLLKDATLEDIVRHLHARNIEPTFRHRLPPSACALSG